MINLKGFRTTTVRYYDDYDKLSDSVIVKWKVDSKKLLLYFNNELYKLDSKNFINYHELDDWYNPSSWTQWKDYKDSNGDTWVEDKLVITPSYINHIVSLHLQERVLLTRLK